MDEYNHSKQSDTSSDSKTQGINLEKNSEKSQSSDYEISSDKENGIDGFPLQGSQSYQNGDYVTPGYNNSNYDNSNYISQNSLSGNDENARTLAIISLICGLISLLLSCCCTCLNFPVAIAGIITGFLSNYDNKQKDIMAIAGIICCIISFFISIGIMIFYVMYRPAE